MIYVYILLILLNTSSAISIYFNRKIEETFFIAIAMKILILFLFGMLSCLDIGFYSILVLNLIFLIYNVYSIHKKPQLLRKNLLTTGLILFLFSCLMIIWINYNRRVTSWDEFSHWALVVKNMFYLNNFGLGAGSTVLAKSYLSGTSLFQYFCVKLGGMYNESILYFGLDLITLSFILPIFKNFKKINSIILLLSYAMILLIPTLFYPYFYSSLYVDAILGVAFAYSLYSYYLNYENGLDKFNVINLSSALMMLIFIKDFGLILSFITVLVILIDNIAIRNKFSLEKLLEKSKTMFFIYVPAILVKVLWIIELNINNVKGGSVNSGVISNAVNLLLNRLEGYKDTVFHNFVHALFFRELSSSSVLRISFIISICMFALLYYLLVYNMKKSIIKKSYVFSAISVVVCAIGYALLILLAYLTIFSDYEALRLASYERYISTYSLAMLIIALALLINKYGISIKKNNIILGLVLASLLCLTNYNTLLNITYHARADVATTESIGKSYQQFIDITDKYVKINQRLYFISTNDNGIDFYIARYELTPKKMNLNYAWSIGDKYNDEDIWTAQRTKEEWTSELIKDYDYVYLFDIDEQFISKYGLLFDTTTSTILDNQLYKVEKKSGTEKLLKLVNNN